MWTRVASGIDAVKVGHLAKQAHLLDQDVRRLVEQVGEEVDAPVGQAPGGAPARELSGPPWLKSSSGTSGCSSRLNSRLSLARLGEQVLGARARAAAGRLGVLAERLVEAPEVRVLAERVVEDRRPRPAHPLDEDVHVGAEDASTLRASGG